MPQLSLRSGKTRLLVVLAVGLFLLAGAVFSDWWICLPDDRVSEYVGGQTCVDCHQAEANLWRGSHHDKAMDRATPETVLGDFGGVTLDHFGIRSRMFRDGERFMVSTEGPHGEIETFEVKYVFGVEPLQQYLVEFDRSPDMPDNVVSRLQVLRISWDTEQKKWFYLSPPDVDEKLAPDDLLHWTGSAQNWNHMCADCHSTNLQKNFDFTTRTYHTTFTDIDVNCETCHGPGSLHVELASSKSLFWDRKVGYGLAKLKTESSLPEIQTCAPCHSRRGVVAANFHAGDNYYDHFANELLGPLTYYCDGQALDEVYVYGSFLQSKMFKEGVRCTDCHNPHTAKVKFDDNRLCTSCHAHDPAKYDTPAHHRHQVGSEGARCVECHMPESPFMEVDLRRDHSMQIPRPEVSIALGTPNACTGCHLDKQNVDPAKADRLRFYANWLTAARGGDAEVQAEIDRANQWSADKVQQWYGDLPETSKTKRVDFATVLHDAWEGHPKADRSLIDLAKNRRVAPIVRASALSRLGWYPSRARSTASVDLLDDRDPQVRVAAVRNLMDLPTRDMLKYVVPLLDDDTRYVRIEAAIVLAGQQAAMNSQQRKKLDEALDAYRDALGRNADLASAHLQLGVLAERQGDVAGAVRAYQNAIAMQPSVTGPRGNLAPLLERQGKVAEAEQLRGEELVLLERDAQTAPHLPSVQYRYGLACYLAGNMDDAESALARAVELEPNSVEYTLGLALLYQKLERFDEAVPLAERLVRLAPGNPGYAEVLQRVRLQAAREVDRSAGPQPE